jgi:hypothetical protein
LDTNTAVVAGSKAGAFHALIRALCLDAKHDIAVRGVLPLRAFALAPAYERRLFEKAAPAKIRPGDHEHGEWDIRYAVDSASETEGASNDAKILRKVVKSIKKRSAQKRKKAAS